MDDRITLEERAVRELMATRIERWNDLAPSQRYERLLVVRERLKYTLRDSFAYPLPKKAR